MFCAVIKILFFGLIDVGRLRYFACVDIRLRIAINIFIPQQGTPRPLLGFQRWLGGFELSDE
jgi:hypothetical protein